MSDTDSFIDEVTEEVRRDRLFKAMRKYGWIAVVAVFGIVGGAAWNEWNKAQERATAEKFGDAMLSALSASNETARAAALSEIAAPNPSSQAMIDLLAASEEAEVTPAIAAQRLLELADRSGIDPVYRQIATLKAVTIPGAGLDVEERRTRLESMALGSGVTRLLAEEQLALIDVELGNKEDAISKLQQLVADAESTSDLRRRATRVIVALGGEPSGAPVEE